jgi:hypothetical protein
MAKERESIDDMIDAHVWMRTTEARLNRLLMLDWIYDELLAEFGLIRVTGGKAFSDPKLVKEIFDRFAGG